MHKQIVLPSQVFHFEGTKSELTELEEFLEFMTKADDMFEWAEEEADEDLEKELHKEVKTVNTTSTTNDNKTAVDPFLELSIMAQEAVEEDLVAY